MGKSKEEDLSVGDPRPTAWLRGMEQVLGMVWILGSLPVASVRQGSLPATSVVPSGLTVPSVPSRASEAHRVILTCMLRFLSQGQSADRHGSQLAG